jgi:hypothetical protein
MVRVVSRTINKSDKAGRSNVKEVMSSFRSAMVGLGPLLFLALVGCKPNASVNSMDEQAVAQVKADFESKWLKRDDSWFTVEDEGMFNRHNLVQVKGVSFKASPPVMSLTEADRLNGAEWSGQVFYSATASRSKPLQGRGDWSGWVDGFRTSSLRPNEVNVKKINGKWEMDAHFDGRHPLPAEMQGVSSP